MLTIWHNPRCSKSHAALALLEERGVSPRVVEYLKTPPKAAEIKKVLAALGASPRGLLRKGEAAYKELRLDDETLSDTALVRAMADNPVLIERPVVINGERAAIGRPPEAVLDVL